MTSVLDEVDDLLRTLVRAGAKRAAIVQEAEPGAKELGGGRWLVVDDGDAPGVLDAKIAEAVRLLRAAARRLGAALEPVAHARGREEPDPVKRAEARVAALVSALAVTEGAAAAALVRRGVVIAEAGGLGEAQRLELDLLVRRVAAEAAKRRGTSHGELVRDDLYARSVGLDGTLFLFFAKAWSRDFVRHRAARVARELGCALPHLDPDPATPGVSAR